jgi:membrane protein YqaA with SNARE-associated domain
MGEKYAFIYENSNQQKIRVFIFSLVFVAIIVAFFIAFRGFIWTEIQSNTIIQSVVNLVKFKFTQLSPAELFVAGLVGGLFFILMPLEVMFYSSIHGGSNPWLSVFMMCAGFTLSQVINYYLGFKFSPLIMNFISKKKVYETRRFVNKYGGYGVFLSNLSPLPAEILTFALGITRYNVYRLYSLQILGTVIKYSAIAGLALLF